MQFTKGSHGLFLYALDVGAYIVASSATIAWSEAVRGGASWMFRFGRYLPIDVHVAADYRPGFGDEEPQTRITFGVGLELPLFALN